MIEGIVLIFILIVLMMIYMKMLRDRGRIVQKESILSGLDISQDYFFLAICVFKKESCAKQFSEYLNSQNKNNEFKISQNGEKWWVIHRFTAKPVSEEVNRVTRYLEENCKRYDGIPGAIEVEDLSSPRAIITCEEYEQSGKN